MKKIFTLMFGIILLGSVLFAQKLIIHTDGSINTFNFTDIDSIVIFASSETGTVTDINGNIYHTVTIGTQVMNDILIEHGIQSSGCTSNEYK